MKNYVPSRSYQHSWDERLNYEVEGPHSGPNMLFLHGFGASLRVWDDIREGITATAHGHFLDLKGCGFSSKPGAGSYSMLQQARIVIGFIRDRQLQDLTLVGHSYGGAVALFSILLLADEDEPPRIQRLILLDSAGYPAKLPFFVSFLRIPIFNRLVTALTLPSIQTLITLTRVYSGLSHIRWARVVRYSFPLRLRGARGALIRIAQQLVPDNLETLIARFTSITTPTLLIWGKQDRVIPVSHAAHFHRDLAQSQVVELDDCGHVPQEEAPRRTVAAIKHFMQM